MTHHYRLIYQPDNQPVVVVIPSPFFEGTKEEVIKASIPHGMTYHEVAPHELPEDDYFRDAWDIKDGKIHHSMDKCRKIHIDRLRQVRNEKLQALDVDMQKALEINDADARQLIAHNKQRLRDMPLDPIFNQAATPEQLKQIIPDYLR